jgi:hypothetical protein
MELLSMNPLLKSNFLEGEQESTMLESCLTFIASLMSIRTNIGKKILLNIMLAQVANASFLTTYFHEFFQVQMNLILID